MATNTINTRIQLKYDTLSNWLTSSTNNFKPLKGEICIAEIPTNDSNSNHLSPPAIGIKVGNGIHTFVELPWIQALAGDVYSWAKQNSIVNDYTRTDLQNLISGEIQDTDTVYRIIAGENNDAGKYFLQSKAKSANDSTFTTVSTIDLSSVQDALEFDGTYNSSTNKVATVSTITSAIAALDGSITGTPAASKTLTSFSETDGIITATFADIAITESQVTNLVSDLAAKAPLASPALTGTPTAPTATAGTNSTQIATTAFVKDAIDTATAGLSGAMHYIGAVNADPTTTAPTGTFSEGDVVTYSNSEYVYDGTNWRELGSESSYALKTITVTAGSGLTGGGNLTENRTIAHAVPTNATSGAHGGTSNTRTYIQSITTDEFGHIVGVTTATETVTDTTYTFAEGSVNGEFSVTPSGGNATQVKVHGLNNAAYKDVSTAIPASGTADDAKVPTVAAVKGLVTDLDSSVAATAASGNVYSVLTGVTQTDGKLTSKTEVTLAAIAKTGSIYDVIEHNTVTENSASLTYLVFDCGDASHIVTDPT